MCMCFKNTSLEMDYIIILIQAMVEYIDVTFYRYRMEKYNNRYFEESINSTPSFIRTTPYC